MQGFGGKSEGDHLEDPCLDGEDKIKINLRNYCI